MQRHEGLNLGSQVVDGSLGQTAVVGTVLEAGLLDDNRGRKTPQCA
jgi:hypothetical protein